MRRIGSIIAALALGVTATLGFTADAHGDGKPSCARQCQQTFAQAIKACSSGPKCQDVCLHSDKETCKACAFECLDERAKAYNACLQTCG